MINNVFLKLCDELAFMAEFDPDLKAGLEYIDKQAHERGITFYEMVFRVLHDDRVSHLVKYN